MASLAVKVLFVALAIAARQVLVSAAGHSSDLSSESLDSSEGSGNNECKGIKREGEPCEDGTGICTRVGMPGKRYGRMQCVPLPTTTPVPTTYADNVNSKTCYDSPEGTTITLMFQSIDVECLACQSPTTCPNPYSCTWDWLSFDENDDGTLEIPKLCGYHMNYVYVSSSNYVCVLFRSDSSCAYQGWSEPVVTWA